MHGVLVHHSPRLNKLRAGGVEKTRWSCALCAARRENEGITDKVAAYQVPIITKNQARQTARDNHRAISDFAINYVVEQEIDDMQQHLHRMEVELKEI